VPKTTCEDELNYERLLTFLDSHAYGAGIDDSGVVLARFFSLMLLERDFAKTLL
jgi:hypothetical protein